MMAVALAHGRDEAEAVEQLSQVLLTSLGSKATKSARLTPRNDFVPGSPGTTCEPMRKPVRSWPNAGPL
jgi:hypothetical protein